MNIDFKEMMSKKTDEEIQVYIDNSKKYLPEAIEAAVAELKLRGRVFSDNEIALINTNIVASKEDVEKDDGAPWSTGFKRNIVKDENAPQFYSKGIIYSCSFLFGTMFSSILLAMNISRTEAKKGAYGVIAFGLIYSGIQISILSAIKNTSPIFLFNIAGAVVLNDYFWNKYIGKETKYRARPALVPFIIGIVISGLLILSFIYSKQSIE